MHTTDDPPETKLEQHPDVAGLFPDSPSGQDALLASIRNTGEVLVPVKVLDGKIVDGWPRPARPSSASSR